MTPEQKRRQLLLLQQQAQVSQSSQPRSMGQALWENLVGDDDPTTQNTGEKIGSFLNKAGEAMTFGLVGDETSAAVESLAPGVSYEDRRDHYRDQEALLEETNPGAAFGAEVAGGLAGVLTPMGAAGTLGRGAGLMSRIGASMGAGGAAGATYGFAEGEGVEDRLRQAQIGGAIGAGAGLAAVPIGAGVQRVADGLVGRRAIRAASRNAPSSDELRAAGQAAYRQIDDAGVQVRPQAFDRARGEITDALRANTGFDELPGPGSLTPNTARVMQIMDNASGELASEPTAAIPFRSLDQMRRQAGAAAGNVANKADQQAGMTVIEGLDDMVQNLGPGDVVAGDVAALQQAIPKARELWGRMSRSQLVDDAIAQEGNYVSGGASAIRNQFARILRNPRLSRGFSEAEKAAMRRVVQGTAGEQILNLMGGGLGQLTQIGAGFGLGGLPGAMVGAGAAAASRKASEAITGRNAEVVRALVANGSMRGQLPIASDASRRLLEGLIRRQSAVTAN